MSEILAQTGTQVAQLIQIQGRVQGHGVRPAVARLAAEIGVTGYVRNSSEGVVVHAEANALAILDEFFCNITNSLPLGMDQVTITVKPALCIRTRSFDIRMAGAADYVATPVPPDIGMCEQCRTEIKEATNRRADYAFTSCTDCGPRYTIIESMPYERCETSMSRFLLCDACESEYQVTSNRRFHAQTNACPDCGPELRLRSCEFKPTADRSSAAVSNRVFRTVDDVCPDDQLNHVAATLAADGILALKGIGGYQLLCDATSNEAVRRLRVRKCRPDKPLAVMMSLDRIEYLEMADAEVTELSRSENSIVLVNNTSLPGLSSLISKGLSTVGVLLPTSPLHESILARFGRPLVVTSGNIDGDSLVFDEESAEAQLSGVANLFLHHNRRIVRSIDDSVVRIVEGRPVTIRCARGIAPLPLSVSTPHGIMAVGGDQKVAIALSNGTQSLLGPHVGVMKTVATRERFVKHVADMQQLYQFTPEVIAHDQHPDYFTTRWAKDCGAQTIAVQHHHAHAVAAMVEHDLLHRSVLGVTFDGTGYGPDGTVWGGEFLKATVAGFTRVASLQQFTLPGGDAAVLQPWRVATALLHAADLLDLSRDTLLANQTDRSRTKESVPTPVCLEAVRQLIRSERCPVSSSMGRLFDGIASLVLGINETTFEGEAAMRLEAACDDSEPSAYSIEMAGTETESQALLCWKTMLREIVDDLQNHVPTGNIAMRFHRAIAEGVAAVAVRFPELPVVLSGGCFQNRVLTELIAAKLGDHPAGLFLPGRIPPNDGGLAVGQLAVAAAILREQEGR